MTDVELRNMVSKTLTCRIDKRLAIVATEKFPVFVCQDKSLCFNSVGYGFLKIINSEYYVIVPFGFQGKLW